MTLKTLQDNINKLLADNPGYSNLTVIYGTDDEDNDFHKVNNNLAPVQVHNLNEYNLELVGFKGEPGIDEKDINAIIIN